jgi:hypothetical protein
VYVQDTSGAESIAAKIASSKLESAFIDKFVAVDNSLTAEAQLFSLPSAYRYAFSDGCTLAIVLIKQERKVHFTINKILRYPNKVQYLIYERPVFFAPSTILPDPTFCHDNWRLSIPCHDYVAIYSPNFIYYRRIPKVLPLTSSNLDLSNFGVISFTMPGGHRVVTMHYYSIHSFIHEGMHEDKCDQIVSFM